MSHVEQELLTLPEHLTSQKFLQTIVGLSILLIILLSVIRFTISDFPHYYLQNFVRKRNIVRNKRRDSLFSQIIANRSENTVTVSQKTGKGNMKGQSAYFKVFARCASPATAGSTIFHITKIERSTGTQTQITSQIFNTTNSTVFFPKSQK
jgi:hypothetical protein